MPSISSRPPAPRLVKRSRPPRIKTASSSTPTPISTSTPTSTSTSTSTSPLAGSTIFWPLLSLTALGWTLYRLLFDFPIWFDESVGKAFFLGLPVWLYILVSRQTEIIAGLDCRKIRPGILLGLALGGIFGFVSSLLAYFRSPGLIQATPLFASNLFWYHFLLAILTGFWESLFFFGFVGTVIFDKYRRQSLLFQLLALVAIFVFFHLPNTFLVFPNAAIPGQVVTLSLFALGQALIFYRWRNLYTLTLSHAIWGLSLLFFS